LSARETVVTPSPVSSAIIFSVGRPRDRAEAFGALRAFGAAGELSSVFIERPARVPRHSLPVPNLYYF
jgi:hypothetical protein